MESPKFFKTSKSLNDEEIFFAENREAINFRDSKMNEKMEMALINLMKMLDYEKMEKVKELTDEEEEYLKSLIDDCEMSGITANEIDLYRKHIWPGRKKGHLFLWEQ